mgnify:CR=1 FL=1
MFVLSHTHTLSFHTDVLMIQSKELPEKKYFLGEFITNQDVLLSSG